uniref:Uncharacterized protein LOC108950017 n=1 Tax=Phallusia mammillata TaxID=59560 RepID=A0A6F9DJS3_9ASCI|nr:uncharacterized protein LOC108950017 [Phallusia mammillata]
MLACPTLRLQRIKNMIPIFCVSLIFTTVDGKANA